jgi:glycosyltransferase involved in cell wall biosynthesis
MEKPVSMKVLIVNFSEKNGGAARASHRLHKSLLQEGVDSTMLVHKKNSNDYRVKGPKTTLEKLSVKINTIINSLLLRFYKPNRTFSTSFGSSGVIKRINELKPDIVHLHWINAGMIRVEGLSKIQAPIVYTLHDMWAFTGGCHYSNECFGYEARCGRCPVLDSKKKHDLSKRIYHRKKRTFSKIPNMTIIGLSKWINERSKKSTLLKDKRHVNLPNPIDINTYKPFDRDTSRKLWNLPKDKNLVLFGAIAATSDSRKGFDQLSNALRKLNKNNIELVVFGSGIPENPQNFGFKTHYLGHIHDDISLVTLYSAADVLIVPSMQENLSNMIIESMACSTPVVAFDIGGNSDMIDHKINGYLAKEFDSSDMANGIEWVINNSQNKELPLKAREKVLSHFESSLVAKKYIKLYTETLLGTK